MGTANEVALLPLDHSTIDQTYFLDELIDATVKFEIYKEKIKNSKLDHACYTPVLQQKEALASSKLAGETQVTLEQVLANQGILNDKNKGLNEVWNCYFAANKGYESLKKRDFSDEFFFDIHKTLLQGNVCLSSQAGKYRTPKNGIEKSGKMNPVTFALPTSDEVPAFMNNLISYINEPKDVYRPLVRAAVLYAQFEIIHPFTDGNGRIARMLTPMFLFAQKQMEFPCFFISEAFERSKYRYYATLNNIREKGDWNEWIKFFLTAVRKQCEKYIQVVTEIDVLYSEHKKIACNMARPEGMVNIIKALFQYPITTVKQIASATKIPIASVNRYLNKLVENNILMLTSPKSRNRIYAYRDFLEILDT